MLAGAYYVKGQADIAKLQGNVLRYAITAGQPLTQGAVVSPSDRGFLAAALTPGMRAVTVPVSAQTAVAGFVFPGDRIDMVLTQDVVGGGDGPPLKVSETILRNIRVLATDQRTDNQAEDGKTPVHTFTTVTVEATPKMAEELAVAQTVGTLSLSLRALAERARRPEWQGRCAADGRPWLLCHRRRRVALSAAHRTRSPERLGAQPRDDRDGGWNHGGWIGRPDLRRHDHRDRHRRPRDARPARQCGRPGRAGQRQRFCRLRAQRHAHGGGN